MTYDRLMFLIVLIGGGAGLLFCETISKWTFGLYWMGFLVYILGNETDHKNKK